MPTLSTKARTHAITFRLDEKEYNDLVKAAESQGSRSLSDFTRAAVMVNVLAERMDKFSEVELDTVIQCIDALAASLREFRLHVRKISALSTSEGN